MSNAWTPILVGVTFPVSEILLLSKTAKFPFLTMDYGSEKIESFGIGSKNLCKKLNHLESAQKIYAGRG